ncbi:hypothetical protein TNCV_310271 [Trichonephila clavipes]|nr:hypothetical protein TNCV_310271 [Trichonephila clavipes]
MQSMTFDLKVIGRIALLMIMAHQLDGNGGSIDPLGKIPRNGIFVIPHYCLMEIVKTFNYITEKNVYGDKFEIKKKKEECINHVSKRLGTGLGNAVKESRALGISLGGKGHGTLKETTIKS